MLVPSSESEWLETAFHKVILKRRQAGGGDPKSAMIACLSLYVKAGLSCDPPMTYEQMKLLLHARLTSPDPKGDKHD